MSVKDDDTGTGSARPHAWHIDEHEYARHEERRGRRHPAGEEPPLGRRDGGVGASRPEPPPGARRGVLRPEVARTYGQAGGTGTPRSRLWHELDVQDDDLLVEKSAPSAFFPGRSPLPRPTDEVIELIREGVSPS